MDWINTHIHARSQPFVQPQQISFGHHSSTPVVIHHQTVLDGKIIAHAVTEHQGIQAQKQQQNRPHFPNPYVSLMPPGYNGR
jgi:hypothetical protein